MTVFRRIPSIEQLLQRPAIARAIDAQGRDAITTALRQAAADLRDRFANASAADMTDESAAEWIASRAVELARTRSAPSLRRVINATGVILHTNLGRAPLAETAASRAAQLAAGYSNLEYDLQTGERGHRHAHAERILRELTGAEAAAVVNNCAAAALLALSALARGREVIVSRGELVEIGGGFRVPEVLAQSGAVLRDVGTTNRTRIGDYAAAIGDRTAVILRVHPSNFIVEGFTERAPLADLVALSRKFSVPLIEDLGSGWLGIADVPALASEPSVRASVAAGVDLVAFSGDKLLGGPQAGIIVGRRDLVAKLSAHPLMRAVRADKLTYAALEATLALWADEPARAEVPILRMLTLSEADVEIRARAVASALSGISGLAAAVIAGASTIGGGSAPGSSLPTRLVSIRSQSIRCRDLAERLRSADPPVISRTQDEAVVLDLRTVAPADDALLVGAVRRAAERGT